MLSMCVRVACVYLLCNLTWRLQFQHSFGSLHICRNCCCTAQLDVVVVAAAGAVAVAAVVAFTALPSIHGAQAEPMCRMRNLTAQ